MKRLVVAAGVGLALLVLAGVAMCGGTALPVGREAPQRLSSVGSAPARAPLEVAPAEGGSSPEAAVEELAAHVAIADALGYVAIRCWAGREYDTDDITADHAARISKGWYLAIESELEGRRFVVREFDRDDVAPDAQPWERKDYEHLFEVSWSATTKGQAAECTVHPLRRFDLRVQVVDQAGAPVSGASVSTCGAMGETDADGRALLQDALAGPSCLASAHFTSDERMCHGEAGVPEIVSDPSLSVVVAVECVDARDDDAVMAFLVGDHEFSSEEARTEVRRELDALRPLVDRSLGEEGDRVLRSLIARQEERLGDLEELQTMEVRHQASMQKLEELTDRIRTASTEEEMGQAFQDLQELLEDERIGSEDPSR